MDARIERQLAGTLRRLAGMSDRERQKLEHACHQTRVSRAAAAAALADRQSVMPGWEMSDLPTRFPRSMAVLDTVFWGRGAAGELSTVQKAALIDAMVAIICQQVANTVGDRLLKTLTSPFV